MSKALLAGLSAILATTLFAALSVYDYFDNLVQPGPWYVHPQILSENQQKIHRVTRTILLSKFTRHDPYSELYGRAAWQAAIGNFDNALDDIDNLIARYPYRNLGDTYFHMGEFEKSARAYADYLDDDPEKPFDTLLCYFARRRAGIDNPTLLVRYCAERPDFTAWPLPLFEALCGKRDWDDVIAKADRAYTFDETMNACEAYFYTGQQKLLEGEKQQAAILFEKCMATGITNYIEFYMARTELQRLGRL